MTNLDYLASKYGQQIGMENKIENIVTSALNILHGQGIYAMFLWLKEKEKGKEKKERSIVRIKLNDLFHDADSPIPNITGGLTDMNNVGNCLTNNLKTMFLAKDLIDLTLTYARHTAKANKQVGG